MCASRQLADTRSQLCLRARVEAVRANTVSVCEKETVCVRGAERSKERESNRTARTEKERERDEVETERERDHVETPPRTHKPAALSGGKSRGNWCAGEDEEACDDALPPTLDPASKSAIKSPPPRVAACEGTLGAPTGPVCVCARAGGCGCVFRCGCVTS